MSKYVSNWVSWGLWDVISIKIFWLLEHLVGSRYSVRYCQRRMYCSVLPVFSHNPAVPCYAVPLSLLASIFSIITLTTLACERYIGMIHNRVISFSWAWRAITYIWLYSLVKSGSPLLGWHRYILGVHVLGCAVGWKSKDISDSSFVLFLFLDCMVVPVGVIAHCYGHILYSIRKVSWRIWMPLLQIVQGRKFSVKENHTLPHSWYSSRGRPTW